MPLKLNSASGSITISAEDGTGNADITLPRSGIGSVSTLSDLSITSTAAEINSLDGFTGDVNDLNTVDVTTLGTVEASKVVTADANGDVTFPDGEILKLGTGGDLRLFHNGSASYITDQGTGNLVIQASDALIAQNGAGTENLFTAYQNGAVTLYYDNSAKIATNANGIGVTGKVEADDIHVSKTTGNAQIGVQADNGIGSIEVGGSTDAFIDIKVPYSDDFDTRYSFNALNCAGDYVLQHTGATKLTTRSYGIDVTGEFIADSYNETYAAVTSSSNATTVDCEAGNAFSHTLTENTTFTFSNPPASGTAYTFSLELIQDASASGYTVTWPTVTWPSGTAPTLTATASGVDLFVFTTTDGGTTWRAMVAAQALA